MKSLITENEKGKYVGEDGKRYNLLACKWVAGSRGKDFVEFNNLQQALKFYKLQEVKNGRGNN